ncbi:MAG: PEP-CTERM sorting domain-containing protein [Acidobacteria bacterium]|nr:PEP-CTERM sorting domain-containing protein [Acidobacteriota bacterium]
MILSAITIAVVAGSLTLQHRRVPGTGAAQSLHSLSPLEQLWTQRQEIPDRLVFPYSVVPGGVQTPEEAVAAARLDPSVAAHYRGIDLNRAVVTKLNQPRLAYVSYRLKGRIYWTRKKLTIAAGERVITDGSNYIRSRCGNRLIEAPQSELSAQEPPESVLNTPEIPVLALTMPPAGAPLVEFAPPSDSPGGSGTRTVTPDFYPPDFYPPGVYPPVPIGSGFIIPPVICCGGAINPVPPGTVPPPTNPPVTPPPAVEPPVNPPPVTPPPVNPPPTTPPIEPPPVTPPVVPPPVNPPPVTPPPVNPPPVEPPPVTPPPDTPPPVTPPPITPPPVTPPPVNPPPVEPPAVTPPPVGPPPVEPPPVNPPPNPVPEPGTYVFVAGGLAVLAWSARRRR